MCVCKMVSGETAVTFLLRKIPVLSAAIIVEKGGGENA